MKSILIICDGMADRLVNGTTPLESAYKLHKAWPEADYIIVPDGGHSALDPAIRDRLLMATDNARSIR